MNDAVIVGGGGPAGSEAAWYLAGRGVPVARYEMRPRAEAGVHRSGQPAELVCTNSLGSQRPTGPKSC